VAECLRAVTTRTSLLGGGDSEWSEHANLRDPFTPFTDSAR